MIKEASEHFVENLLNKPALIPLYKNRNMNLELQSSHEKIWLKFSNNQCQILRDQPENVDIVVSGENEYIEALIKGYERLTLMEEEGRITVQGSLRNLLSLESLFVLSRDGSSLLQH